jgi:hypothetical protein
MANTVNLNANNSNDVSSVQKVSVLTAEPSVWLLIYSGIAYQRQRAEGDSGFLGIGESSSETKANVSVTLDNISGVLLQAATTASMSNILEEDTWGQWIIESTSLSLHDNGDLVLSVNTSVTGIDDAEFYAFYYYVSAKVILDTASISGMIQWKKTLAAPLGTAHFKITAYTEIPGPPGSLLPLRHVEAAGIENPVDSSDSTFHRVPYTITGALLGKTLRVDVVPIPSSFSGAPTSGPLLVAQISGPNPINLNTTNRHATNVNFDMDVVLGPH